MTIPSTSPLSQMYREELHDLLRDASWRTARSRSIRCLAWHAVGDRLAHVIASAVADGYRPTPEVVDAWRGVRAHVIALTGLPLVTA